MQLQGSASHYSSQPALFWPTNGTGHPGGGEGEEGAKEREGKGEGRGEGRKKGRKGVGQEGGALVAADVRVYSAVGFLTCFKMAARLSTKLPRVRRSWW